MEPPRPNPVRLQPHAHTLRNPPKILLPAYARLRRFDEILLGLPVDSATGNAFVQHYAASGTMPQMEAAYRRLKKSRLLVSTDAIRAMASAYISQRKHYKLGEFVNDVGLGRRNAGNLDRETEWMLI